VIDEEGALTVDVTVSFENRDALARGAHEKVGKYQSLAEYLVLQETVREAQVLPIVIDSR
jgi:hypothetical protein